MELTMTTFAIITFMLSVLYATGFSMTLRTGIVPTEDKHILALAWAVLCGTGVVFASIFTVA